MPTTDRKRNPATETDAALIARAVQTYGSQNAAAKAIGISQPRLSRASVAGKGRALSDKMRAMLEAQCSI